MTTASIAETPEPPGPPDGRQSWGNIAVGYTGKMARADFSRGDLAGLRRMDPDSARPGIFWKLLAEDNLLEHGQIVENKWALILHGIALMTPTNTGEGAARTAHEGAIPVGRALYSGGYSEMRFNRLLTAREDMLRTLLARMFRMMAAKDIFFNWREMAQFILNDGYDEEAAEQSRRRIARDYYRAERQSPESD